MQAASFAEIEQEFLERVRRVVWCNVATIDRQNRPRSRILHPIWEGATGWITTDPRTLKAKHLEQNPFVSLAYVAEIGKPVYVDCKAEWVDDLEQKQRIWDLVKNAPPPVGFDPAPIYERVDHPRFGVLKLTPWRIEVRDVPGERRVWKPALL
jgi:general stress protein 26